MAPKEKKIVRASDSSLLKRFAKRFGTKLIEDMTDKQMQKMLDEPDSVFGKFKTISKVENERLKRKRLTSKAYQDKILRDDSDMVKDMKFEKAMKKRYNERRNKVQSKSLGGYMGVVMAGRGGSFKGSS
jgi:Asp-tRNA(Asn)/Glu-tRNA(Gln) amidotransferase C subunit